MAGLVVVGARASPTDYGRPSGGCCKELGRLQLTMAGLVVVGARSFSS